MAVRGEWIGRMLVVHRPAEEAQVARAGVHVERVPRDGTAAQDVAPAIAAGGAHEGLVDGAGSVLIDRAGGDRAGAAACPCGCVGKMRFSDRVPRSKADVDAPGLFSAEGGGAAIATSAQRWIA